MKIAEFLKGISHYIWSSYNIRVILARVNFFPSISKCAHLDYAVDTTEFFIISFFLLIFVFQIMWIVTVINRIHFSVLKVSFLYTCIFEFLSTLSVIKSLSKSNHIIFIDNLYWLCVCFDWENYSIFTGWRRHIGSSTCARPFIRNRNRGHFSGNCRNLVDYTTDLWPSNERRSCKRFPEPIAHIL